MDIELITLGFLMSGPKTGYRLKTISGKMMMFYSITLNKIYPVLRKLEDSGHIKKEVVFQTGKPNRHLYCMTPSGKAYFFEKLTGPPLPLDLSFPFFVKSFFFRFLDENQIASEFEKELQSIEELLEDLDKRTATVASQADPHGRFIFQTTVKLLKTMQSAYLEQLSKQRSRP